MRFALLLLLVAAPIESQIASNGLALSGVVLDAASKQPIATATVTVAATRGEPRRTRVDSLGRYLIRGLVPGEYTITVRALGYAPARLELRLAPSSASDISVGLQHQPFYLEHVDITAERARSSTFAATGDDTRALLELDRQHRFPSSDARVLTFGDVTKNIAPVQPDLLRAIQALPGVSGRDDYSAELWTRGSPWSQTRVTFDGIPLYNPLHAAGAMSAISLDGLGGVVFHPGVQPVGPSQGVAGRVALTSRPSSTTQLRGSTELSILSGGISMEGTAGGRTAYTFAARRSHIDLWSRALGVVGSDSTGGIPYVFSDAILRIDHSLSDRWKLSTSGIVARDQLNGSIDDIVYAHRARWGSLAARTSITLQTERGSLEHTIGASGFTATGNPPRGTGVDQDIYSVQRTDNAINSLFVQGEWQSTRYDRGRGYSIGYRLSDASARYFTTGDWPRDSIPRDTLRGETELRSMSVWAEQTATIGRLSFHTGTSVDANVGQKILDAPGLRWAPRLSLRWKVDSAATSITAAYGRSWQYEQTLMQNGGARHAIATSGMFWMLAGLNLPAVRADLITVGSERWFGSRTLASITAFDRRTEGMAIAAPWSGAAGTRARWVLGAQHARGIELSARRLSGRTTGSASYTYQRSDLSASDLTFAAPWERRHSLQLRGWTRIADALHAGGALVIATGAPFTQFIDGKVECDSLVARCQWSEQPTVGEASAAREPGYRSLDLAAQWSRSWDGRSLVVYGTIKNVLDIGNPAAYLQSHCPSGDGSTVAPTSCADPVHDRLRGLGRLPTIGVRFTF